MEFPDTALKRNTTRATVHHHYTRSLKVYAENKRCCTSVEKASFVDISERLAETSRKGQVVT
jgi:hypothetical protein